LYEREREGGREREEEVGALGLSERERGRERGRVCRKSQHISDEKGKL